MKRLRFLVICALVALLFTGCTDIRGDKLEVTSVSAGGGGFKYSVVAVECDSRGVKSFVITIHTDHLYSVGDTITIK